MKTTKNDSTAETLEMEVMKMARLEFQDGVAGTEDILDFLDEVMVKVAQALTRKDEEWKEKVQGLRKRKRRISTHAGHSIDEYYCIQCGKGIDVHPDKIFGYNEAVDEFNKKLDELLK